MSGMPSENWAAPEFHRTRDLSRQPSEPSFPLFDRRRPVYLRSNQTRTTLNHKLPSPGYLLYKYSSSQGDTHILLDTQNSRPPRTLHGAPARQYSFSNPHQCITPLSLTQGSRTIMDLCPEKPYQPRGPYQSRRSKREYASLPEVFAMNSNTLGTEPAKKRHCVSMACMPCRTRRTKVSDNSLIPVDLRGCRNFILRSS